MKINNGSGFQDPQLEIQQIESMRTHRRAANSLNRALRQKLEDGRRRHLIRCPDELDPYHIFPLPEAGARQCAARWSKTNNKNTYRILRPGLPSLRVEKSV